jgi:hypothetical protein
MAHGRRAAGVSLPILPLPIKNQRADARRSPTVRHKFCAQGVASPPCDRVKQAHGDSCHIAWTGYRASVSACQ